MGSDGHSGEPPESGGLPSEVAYSGSGKRTPAWAAALAGCAAGSIAVAFSELLAGLVKGVPSLVLAVGDLVIRLQPPGAKDVVVGLLGVRDKPALNIVVVLVAVAATTVAGLLGRLRFEAGAAVILVFGILAMIAGVLEPLSTRPAAVLSATGAVTLALLTLRLLLRQMPPANLPAPAKAHDVQPAGPRREPSASPVEAIGWSRRRFLIASGGTIGAAVVGGSAGRMLVNGQHPAGVVTTSRLPAALQRVQALGADQALAVPRVTPLVVSNGEFYRIDTALLVPRVDVQQWSLKVKGMVEHPLTFSYDELLAMPLVEQYVTLACVSNEVGGHLVGNMLWTGVRLKQVLEMAGVHPRATQVVGRSVDEFWAGFPTAWAMAPEREPMIAVGMNRKPLPAEHGFPARLIVPGLFGYVSATKWLSTIELTTREAVDGYWVPLGYAKDAPILTQSRIDVPKHDQVLASGPVQVAGVAWAPDRGIRRVEVRIDDGDWHDAQVSRPISTATWVQWLATWQATPGRHAIEVRATDGTGAVQTDRRTNAGAPDGARGHHRISALVG